MKWHKHENIWKLSRKNNILIMFYLILFILWLGLWASNKIGPPSVIQVMFTLVILNHFLTYLTPPIAAWRHLWTAPYHSAPILIFIWFELKSLNLSLKTAHPFLFIFDLNWKDLIFSLLQCTYTHLHWIWT